MVWNSFKYQVISISEEYPLPSDWHDYVEEKKREIEGQIKRGQRNVLESVKTILLKLVEDLEGDRVTLNAVAATCISLLDLVSDEAKVLNDLLLEGTTINEAPPHRDTDPEIFIASIKEFYDVQ